MAVRTKPVSLFVATMSRKHVLRILLMLSALITQSCGVFAFAVANNPASIKLVPASLKQGQTVAVLVTLPPNTVPPTVTFNKKEYRFFIDESVSQSAANEGGQIYRALIAVPADIKPGAYDLKIGDIEKKVTVADGGFGVQRIRLPKDKDNFVPSPGEEEAVKKAKMTVSSQQLWQGEFKKPCKARTSTGFGLRRIVNGKLLTDYFHSGLDFAGGLGAPIYAAQDGKVLLAHAGWKLHGGTVAIDHGDGVITFYIHMSKILAKEGQTVKAGQEIGKVGMTGRANGPHLHFSVYVNGEATNPQDWFSRVY